MSSSITKVKKMNKDKITYILRPLLTLVICMLMVIYMIYIVDKKINEAYKLAYEQYETRIVEAYDKAYDDGYDDGINDLLEDYYDVLIENKILKERLKNNPNNEAYIEQIVDDFELVVELQKYYYQENITSHSFGDWLKLNHYGLYKRIESYF